MGKDFNQFRILFEESADANLIIDDEKFIDCNQAAVQMLRYRTKEELLNTHPSELSPPFQPDGRRSFEKAQQMMRIAFEKGSHRFEWDHRRADGEVFPVEVLLTRIPTDQKDILHTVWRDITDRRKFEEKLKRSEQTLKAVFDHSFQFTGMLSPDGRLLAANKSSIESVGIQMEDVEGVFFWDTPWWSHSAELQEQMKQAIKLAAKGEFVRFEAQHPAADGSYILVDFSLKPVTDENGEVHMLIPEGRDITEIRKTQAQLVQSQKMETVGTLAGGIAHDFNNILGGLLGTLSLVRHKWDSESGSKKMMDKYLNLMESSCERASQIVRQLLSLSREESISLAPVDLNRSLEHVMGILEHSIDKSIKLIAGYYPTPMVVYADPIQIEQVILNLCINAAHAMTIMRPEGASWGGMLRVTLAPTDISVGHFGNDASPADGRYICLSVQDTGVGIPQEHHDQIYDPFFSTKTKERGSGLGLSIIYNILEQHGGFVQLQSEVGKGTTFSVLLPQAEKEQEQKDKAKQEENLAKGSGLVLVLEDEDVLREVIQSILEECGYSALVADNGRSGVELYEEHQEEIDCVIMDMAMPVMSGKEAFIRMKELNPKVKVILVSGYEQDKRVQETIDRGVKRFLKKPFTFRTLADAVAKVIHED